MDFPFFHKSPPDPGSRGMLEGGGSAALPGARASAGGCLCNASPKKTKPKTPKKPTSGAGSQRSPRSLPWLGLRRRKNSFYFKQILGAEKRRSSQAGKGCGGKLGRDGRAGAARAAPHGAPASLQQPCSPPGHPGLPPHGAGKGMERLVGSRERRNTRGVPPMERLSAPSPSQTTLGPPNSSPDYFGDA